MAVSKLTTPKSQIFHDFRTNEHRILLYDEVTGDASGGNVTFWADFAGDEDFRNIFSNTHQYSLARIDLYTNDLLVTDITWYITDWCFDMMKVDIKSSETPSAGVYWEAFSPPMLLGSKRKITVGAFVIQYDVNTNAKTYRYQMQFIGDPKIRIQDTLPIST